MADYTEVYTTQALWDKFRVVFKDLKFTEPYWEQRYEESWERKYRDIKNVNFAEIVANKLTNYTIEDFNASIKDETLNKQLKRLNAKIYKATQMAYAIGRVYLMPYSINNKVYIDIVPQSRAVVTNTMGDDVIGIGVLADTRIVNKQTFHRFASYIYNDINKTFTITNRVCRSGGNTKEAQPVALTAVEEWATIPEQIIVQNIDRPLFTFIDCPKDNRNTDKLNGAGITYGCENTIREIYDLMLQFSDEYDLKQTWLGVDKLMIGKEEERQTNKFQKMFKLFDGKSNENLFEIFSPDIRFDAYNNKLQEMLGRLETQIGLSRGILTELHTSNATATEVKRGMFDTLAMVKRMRHSIKNAYKELIPILTVQNKINGVNVNTDDDVQFNFGDTLEQDESTKFNEMVQLASQKILSKAEVRAYVTNETIEEATEKIEAIKASEPDTIGDIFGG